MTKLLFLPLIALLGCSGCATYILAGSPTIVRLQPTVQTALFGLYAATTGQPTGPEIGLCLVGHRIGHTIHVTSVVVPSYQEGNTRTAIRGFSCTGIEGVVGRAHFHPSYEWGETCLRSGTDALSHQMGGMAIDLVYCSGGRYKWYTIDGSTGGRS